MSRLNYITFFHRTPVSNITEYTYDCWNQCTGIVYNKDSQNEITVSTSYDALGKQTSITSGNETVSYTYNSLGDILTATNSDGTTTYTYQNGLVVSRVNPDNTTASYLYDSYGNLTNHSYNGYSFTYNTLGSILTANSCSQNLATYTYSQDTKQNVLTASYGNGQTLSYSYNSDNELQGVNYGGSTKYGYTYAKNSNDEITATTVVDEVSNLISVIEDNKTTVKASDSSIKYVVEHKSKEESNDDFTGTQITIGSTVFKTKTAGNSDNFVKNDTELFTKTNEKNSSGNIIRTQTGDAITTTYGYRGDGKVSGVNNTLGNMGLEYSYSYNGNDGVATETLIRHDRGSLGETQDSAIVTNYTYDSKGQLIATENNDTKWTYTYDQRGNILTAKEYEVSETNGVRTYTLKPNGQKNYTYDSTWGDKLISVGGQSISYDSVGNPTSYRGNSLTWSMGRELASFGGVSYTYNDNGIRTSKTSNGVTTEYFLNGTDIIRQSDGTTTLDFFYDGSGSLTGFEYQGNIYYYVKNLQNDIVAITDVNGTVLAEYTYSPFGEVLSVMGSNTTVGNLNPFRYRSYYFDTDTGLYYLQSRYYDPEIGRFLNSDDVNYIGATESEISYNPFAYCENNPITREDQMGYGWIDIVKAIVVSASFALRLSIMMYAYSATGARIKNNISLNDWWNPIGSAMKTRLKNSSHMISRIKTYIGKTSSSNRKYSKTETIYFGGRKSIPDMDLAYSVGHASNCTVKVEWTTQKNSAGKRKYNITITLKDIYDFALFGKNEKNIVKRAINDYFGYYPQSYGVIKPYNWSISFSYNLYY